MAQLPRVSLQFDEKVLEYIDEEASRIGVSRSAMISFMVEQYKTQKETIASMAVLQDVLNRMDEEKTKS